MIYTTMRKTIDQFRLTAEQSLGGTKCHKLVSCSPVPDDRTRNMVPVYSMLSPQMTVPHLSRIGLSISVNKKMMKGFDDNI